ILQIVFGTPEHDTSRDIIELFHSTILKDLGTWSPWIRFGRLQRHFREVIAAAILRRRGKTDPGSGLLFDMLISVQDEQGQYLPGEEIQDHIFTMLIAGVDPAAIGIAWALYWILENPEVKARLQGELQAAGFDRCGTVSRPCHGQETVAQRVELCELAYLTA